MDSDSSAGGVLAVVVCTFAAEFVTLPGSSHSRDCRHHSYRFATQVERGAEARFVRRLPSCSDTGDGPTMRLFVKLVVMSFAIRWKSCESWTRRQAALSRSWPTAAAGLELCGGLVWGPYEARRDVRLEATVNRPRKAMYG